MFFFCKIEIDHRDSIDFKITNWMNGGKIFVKHIQTQNKKLMKKKFPISKISTTVTSSFVFDEFLQKKKTKFNFFCFELLLIEQKKIDVKIKRFSKEWIFCIHISRDYVLKKEKKDKESQNFNTHLFQTIFCKTN